MIIIPFRRWRYDGPPVDSIWDISRRLDNLVDPWQKLRVRMLWIFGGYMTRRVRR